MKEKIMAIALSIIYGNVVGWNINCVCKWV